MEQKSNYDKVRKWGKEEFCLRPFPLVHCLDSSILDRINDYTVYRTCKRQQLKF